MPAVTKTFALTLHQPKLTVMLMELSFCWRPRLVSLHGPVQCQTDMFDCSMLPQKSLAQHCTAPCQSTQGRLQNLISFILPSREVKLIGTLLHFFPSFVLFNSIPHAIRLNLTYLVGGLLQEGLNQLIIVQFSINPCQPNKS